MSKPSKPDWEALERDVVERIRVLRTVSENANPLRDKIWDDLIVPNLRLLAEFCICVDIEPDGSPAPRARG